MKIGILVWFMFATLAVAQAPRPPVDKFSRLTDVDITGLATGQQFKWNGTKLVPVGTTVGENIFALTNPSAITFLRVNANNTIDALSASAFRTAIGAGTSSFDGVFSSLSGKPTTIAGYGITDFNSLGDARWSLLTHTHAFSSLTGIPTYSNTLYVDSAGNNGTGTRGRPDLPFATLVAAHSAASDGDHIIVRPGTYTGGQVGISKNNLTVDGYGVTWNASSQSDVGKIQLTGTGNRVRGFTFNGTWTSAADVDVGVIQISNTDNVVEDCYVHHSAGHGIRLDQAFSRCRINKNRVEYCNIGIPTALYGSTNVDGLDITYNLVQNNRNGGIRPTNNSGGDRYIRNEKIVGNTVQNNGAGSLNIELWGGGLTGTYAPHQRAIVTNNYIGGGSAFGISMNACVDSIVSDNVVIAGTFCGIEWANSKRGKSSGNYIDAAAITGSGASGFSMSNNEGTGANTNIDIDDNVIVNSNGGPGVFATSMNGVHVRHNSVYGNRLVSFAFCQNVEAIENYAELGSTTDYGIYTETSAAATVSGFYYTGNRFNRVGGTSAYPVFYFYSSASNATFNDVNIQGNRTNQTFSGSGFLDKGGNTVNFSSIHDNIPQEVSQYGFADSQRFYDLQVTNEITLSSLTASTFVETDSAKKLISRTAAEMRTDLGLVIGTNVQAYDADLTTWAGITPGGGVGTFLATPSGANLASALTTAIPVSKGGTAGTSIITAWDSLATKGSDIASASTTDLSTTTGYFVNVTGTTTINGFGTMAAGTRRMLKFTGTGTITHNATSLILNGVNKVRAANDYAEFESLGSGNWRCVWYMDASGRSLGAPNQELNIDSDPQFHSVQVGTPLARAGGTIFTHFTDTSTTSTDGSEDQLYVDTLVGSTFGTNGDSVTEIEHVKFVSSATATRRLKKYFASTLIFDSGSLTLTLGGDFTLETTIIRESASVVRCDVAVTSTSASSVPYSTFTRITGLTLSAANDLETDAIASGTGAASGDILDKMARITWFPAP